MNKIAPSTLIEEAQTVPLGAPGMDAVLGGLRLGALHEVFAADAASAGAASGFTLGLALRAARAKRLLWVRQDFAAREYGALSPLGLLELGLDPDGLILVRAPDALAALRAMQEGLACASLGAVIAEIYGAPKILDLTASRRLGLAAAKTGVTALLLRHNGTRLPSAAETRWIVVPAPSLAGELWGAPRLAVTLARNRHGLTGRFVLAFKHGLFHDVQVHSEAHSGAVVPAPADRPAAAPARLQA